MDADGAPARIADAEPAGGFVDLAALLGLFGIVAGVIALGSTDLGADPAAALGAILAWAPVTLPVGLAVGAAAAVDIGAGVVLARAVRARPFERLDEAILQGTAAAIVKDVVLLGVLAGAGLFLQPLLIAVHAAILGSAVLRRSPILAPAAVPGPVRPSLLGLLVVVAWSAPVLLQLASPIVPFLDVLPNHVAPAEHLRTFGTLGALTDTHSPIYGPSRIFLGYSAWLGTVTTLTGLPAGEALAGFILPSTILVAVAIRRLAVALAGPDAAPWVLLAAALTTTVARLGDARATVVVLPLIAWPLAVLAERLAEPVGTDVRRAPGGNGRGGVAARLPIPLPRRRPGEPWLPESVGLGLALGAATLVHPVIGFLAVVAVGIVALALPARAAALGLPAIATAAVVALPQAATMIGVGLPPVALIPALLAGILTGLVVAAAPGLRGVIVVAARVTAAALGMLALVAAGPVIRAAVAGAQPLLSVMELSVVAAAAATVLGVPAARSPVVWAALAGGFGVAAVSQLVPEEGSGLLGQALRFELPKTLHYWVPVFVAVLAGAGLAAIPRASHLPLAARGVALAAFVGTAALPIRTAPIDAFHLGEHRLSETASIALRWAERGFWVGFPDNRYVVDAERRALLAAVRAEIEAGGILHDTPILHVAGSFQQWVATPLGVFAGVEETVVSPDAVESIHTVGGRLRPLDDLAPSLMCAGYVVLEPHPDLPPGLATVIEDAGFSPIFGNGQATLYQRDASPAFHVSRAPCR